MSEDAALVGEKVVPATRIIGNVKDGTGKYRRNQILFVMGQSDQAEIDENIADISAAADEYEQKYTSNATDAKALEAFRAAWETYVSATTGVFSLPANDGDGVSSIISDGEGDAAWEAVKASLAAWDDANTKTANAVVGETRASASTLKKTSIGLLIGGLLIAAGIATLLTRALTRGLRRLVAAARGIADGNIEQDLQLTSNDELGDAGRAFDAMIDYRATASRPRTGLRRVTCRPTSRRTPTRTRSVTHCRI